MDKNGLSASIVGMARKLRVEYSGAICRVENRGDRREPIFQDRTDHELFLSTLREKTLVTLGWIARRLQMGCVAYLNSRLYLLRKGRLVGDNRT